MASYISDYGEKKQKRQKPDTVQDRDNGSAMRKGMSTIAFGSHRTIKCLLPIPQGADDAGGLAAGCRYPKKISNNFSAIKYNNVNIWHAYGCLVCMAKRCREPYLI